jgi:hypothetical protein
MGTFACVGTATMSLCNKSNFESISIRGIDHWESGNLPSLLSKVNFVPTLINLNILSPKKILTTKTSRVLMST